MTRPRSRVGGRSRLHAARPSSRRRDQAQGADSRLARPTLGRRGLPLLDEPQPRPAHPLEQEGRKSSRVHAPRRRPHRLQKSPRRHPTGLDPYTVGAAAAASPDARRQGREPPIGGVDRAPSSVVREQDERYCKVTSTGMTPRPATSEPRAFPSTAPNDFVGSPALMAWPGVRDVVSGSPMPIGAKSASTLQ